MRSTTKETSSFVTTAILKKQQRKDERGLELKDQITKRAKRDKNSVLAIHNRLLSRSNDTLLHFFQTHELDGDNIDYYEEKKLNKAIQRFKDHVKDAITRFTDLRQEEGFIWRDYDAFLEGTLPMHKAKDEDQL